MTSDISLIKFKAISNFTECLSEVFGKDQRPLRLYSHLLKKTKLSHVKPIEKHITAFTEFCIKNRRGILNKNHQELEVTVIKYSERVFIDMKPIFAKADTETREIIWTHLLTISATVDPAGKAKQILEENAKKGDNEASFLNNIIGKVEEQVDPTTAKNPMAAVSSIMNSGIFTELLGGMGSGIQNGSLDLGKLMGTVQNMVGSLTSQMQDSGASDGAPDLTGMLGMLTPMLNSINPGQQQTSTEPVQTPEEVVQEVEEKVEEKVEEN